MQSYIIGILDAYFNQVKESGLMLIYYILTSSYNWFINLLIGDNKSIKDEEHADKDVILKMTMFGIILLLSFLSTYYMPYIVLILMSMSK